MPLAPQLDTAGFLTRDPEIWVEAAKALYADLPFYDTYPKTLYTVGFPTSGDDEADAVVLDFLGKLEEFLGTSSTALNLSTLWSTTKPQGVDADLDDFLNITYPILISKEQTMLVRDPFYAAYAAAHDGRRPFIDPAPLVRQPHHIPSSSHQIKLIPPQHRSAGPLAIPTPTPPSQKPSPTKRFFKLGGARKCSKTTASPAQIVCYCTPLVRIPFTEMNIMGTHTSSPPSPFSLNPASPSTASYSKLSPPNLTNPTNPPRSPPAVPSGFSTSRISPFAEVPDFVIPIGQAAYNSTITLHTEYLPVTVDILAAKGCDGLIFNLVRDLQAAGVVKATLTGGTIYGGEVLLRE